MEKEKAIEIFNRQINCYKTDREKCVSLASCSHCKHNVTPEELTEAMQMAISALEKQEQDRWIPVTERLPKVHESGNSFSGIFMQSDPVLVYGVVEDEEEAQFHVATYCDDLDGYTYWSTELDALTIKGVKAWRPLPEPYTEEEA